MSTFDFSGRTAVVTGGSRGIGHAVAQALAAGGANVVLTSRRQEAAEAAAAQVRGSAVGFGAHVVDEEAARSCLDFARERFGSVDILVNNAGTNPAHGRMIDQDHARFAKTFDVNLWGPLLWTSLAVRSWMGEHGGAVVNVASVGGMAVEADLGVYNATKAALIHSTRQLALELGPRVRVNAVAPAVVRTRLAEGLWQGNEDRLKAAFALGRIGEPEDVADLVAFLASDSASWITGETVVVDGGALLGDATALKAPSGAQEAAVSSSATFRLDGLAIEEWVASLGIPFTAPLRFERIGMGQSNLTYLLSDRRGWRWVVRRPPLGPLLPSAHDVAREARILLALEDCDVPTPRVFGARLIDDVPHMLLEFVDGPVLDQLSVAEALSAEQRHAVGISLAKTLARIHAVDLEATGLANLSIRRPYAGRQLKRWSVQWEKSRTRDLPALDALTQRLLAAVPAQCETTLVHGDFHLRNVITERDSGGVAAVLDWELATLGDPLADLGSLLAYWPEPGEAVGAERSASVLPGFPSRDEMATAYFAESGRDPDALGFWHVLGLWKIAIICEGVLRRVQTDPRNRASSGIPTALQIEEIVASATQVADATGI